MFHRNILNSERSPPNPCGNKKAQIGLHTSHNKMLQNWRLNRKRETSLELQICSISETDLAKDIINHNTVNSCSWMSKFLFTWNLLSSVFKVGFSNKNNGPLENRKRLNV